MCYLTCCSGFLGGAEVKVSACNVGDLGSIPGSGRSPGEGNGNPLQYSCLENPRDRGAWQAAAHRVTRVTKSRTQLKLLSTYTHTHTHTHTHTVFPGASAGKGSACSGGDPGSIPGLGRSSGEENGNPLQYSSLENSMDRRACQAIEHGVAKSQT